MLINLCDEVQLHIEPFNGETWTLFIRTYFKNNLPCWFLAENLLQIRGICYKKKKKRNFFHVQEWPYYLV
mgnify:CR=1 FL=1